MATTVTVPDALRVPTDIAETVFSPKSYTSDDIIYPALAWLRHNVPLGLSEVPGYDPIWIVTRHDDIRDISKDAKLFPSGEFNPILNTQAGDEFVRQMNEGKNQSLQSLTFMDPPVHGKYRNVTSNWFMPGRVRSMEDKIRTMARASVDHLMSFDGECDFVKDFALHFPLRVVMSLIGVPPEDEPVMLRLTQDFYGGQDPEEQREEIALDPVVAAKQWHATLQDFYNYFDTLSAARRLDPRDDVVSLIANAKVDGDYVPRDVANGYYVALAAAGHDTTSSSASGALYGMIRFPEQFDLLKNDPGLTLGLVEETIRWNCPVKQFLRSTSAETEVGGVRLPKDARLFLSYPAACRDEKYFPDPDRFDMRRDPNKHIAFGFGPHMCLGLHLARLELKILFEELMPRLKSVELAGTPRWVEANFLSGLKSLPIRFKKA